LLALLAPSGTGGLGSQLHSGKQDKGVDAKNPPEYPVDVLYKRPSHFQYPSHLLLFA
jgi:hypothetical protein